MFTKIKLLMAIVFIVCLFLPLSSCQYQVPDPKTKEMVDQTEFYYALPDKAENAGLWRIAIVVVFVLPLLLSLAQVVGKTGHYGLDVIDILLAASLLAYINFYAYFTKLLAGGYLLYAAAIVYLLLSFTLLVQRIIAWRKTYAHHPR